MRRRRLFTAKRGFTAWAMLVFVFLYLPIAVVVMFAFNGPSTTSLASYHGSNVCSLPPTRLGNIAVWNEFETCWFSEGLHDSTFIPAIKTSPASMGTSRNHQNDRMEVTAGIVNRSSVF